MVGLPQMRLSRRKVRGGLDGEARSRLGQVVAYVRFATGSRSRRLAALRWRTEGRSEVSRRYMDYAEKAGTPELLTSLALGRVTSCPFPYSGIGEVKRGVVDYLQTEGFSLERHPEDRTDVPIDFRYLALLLRASCDPEISLGDFSWGVRVGPGVRLPRLLALYQRKRKWRLPDRDDSTAFLESETVGDPTR